MDTKQMYGIDLIYSHFNLHATCISNAVADRVYLSERLFIRGTRDEYNFTFRISVCYFWCTSNIITEITDQMTSVDLHHFLTTTRSQVESKVHSRVILRNSGTTSILRPVARCQQIIPTLRLDLSFSQLDKTQVKLGRVFSNVFTKPDFNTDKKGISYYK